MSEKRKIELVVGEILNRKPSDLALIALLKEKDGADEGLRCLPVLVGPLEAQAIIVNLFRHRIPHPGIYDLYLNTLKQDKRRHFLLPSVH